MWQYHCLAALILSSCLLGSHSSPNSTQSTTVESGAEFLKTVMHHLQSERVHHDMSTDMNRISQVSKVVATTAGPAVVEEPIMGDYKIVGPTPLPAHMHMDSEMVHSPNSTQTSPLHQIVNSPNVPPPPLSKEELMALYQAAVSKGASLASMASSSPGVAAGLQELQSLLAAAPGHTASKGTIPGYYYYFYPIKSFMKDHKGTKHKQEAHEDHNDHNDHKPDMAHMVPTAVMMMEGGEKNVEPLFMAVAGFIGMTLMFVVSVLFLPKFGNLRSRGISAIKNAPDELAGLTKLVFEAIDGKDCTERIACEVGRAFRKMQLDNKPIRILEILLPPALGKQLQQVRKAAAKREKCNFIPCKWKRTKQ